MFAAMERPQAFAELVTSDGFRFWALRGVVGIPLETIGTLALFFGLVGAAGENWAFWGMLLCVLGDLFGIAAFAIFAFVFPDLGTAMLDGQEGVASIAALDDFMPVFMGSMLATYVGLALFAVAVWRSGRFPRWSGVVVLFGFLLIPIQNYAVQISANIIWGVGYLWMAWAFWRTEH